MDSSILYNMLSLGILKKWQRTEEENNDFFVQEENNKKETLLKELSENNKNLLHLYVIAIINRLDNQNMNLNAKTLHLGIQIGMELEKAFREYED